MAVKNIALALVAALALVLAALAGPVMAQTAKPADKCYNAKGEVIKADKKNAKNDECLALPPQQEATNFIGGLGPAALIGGGALAALAGGGGSTNNTTSTTSTN